jgi:hypothetical protein
MSGSTGDHSVPSVPLMVGEGLASSRRETNVPQSTFVTVLGSQTDPFRLEHLNEPDIRKLMVDGNRRTDVGLVQFLNSCLSLASEYSPNEKKWKYWHIAISWISGVL